MNRLWVGWFVWLMPMVFLWQTLIRHLSVEWTLNPSYRYGWAVPFLCAYLIWKDLNWRVEGNRQANRVARLFNDRTAIGGVVLAFCYAPLRFVQEPNPDWRLVSWGLAVDVLGLTLLLISWLIHFCQKQRCTGLPFPGSLFPFLFFLTAIPWPSLIESRLVKVLTALITITTSEVLSVIGMPNLTHGNLIEVGTGRISIEEGCSGIRSLQSSLMVALFFGQVNGLSLAGRFLCLFAGGTLAVALNLVRAVLLALLVAGGDASQTKLWHEVLGIVMPVTLFIGVWLGAVLLSWKLSAPASTTAATSAPKLADHSPPMFGGWAGSLMLPAGLMLWLGVVEILKGAWYDYHRPDRHSAVEWHVEAPRSQTEFREVPFSSSARQFLRFDEGSNSTWLSGNGMRCQAIYLRWEPGTYAMHLAQSHMPEECLVACGYEVIGSPHIHTVRVKGLELTFRVYLARGEAEPVHVFYCLWQDGAGCQPVEASWLTYRYRLASVLKARCNTGQRSLELAVWGASSEEEARSAMAEALDEIIRLDP